jgi:hypothetical protein
VIFTKKNKKPHKLLVLERLNKAGMTGVFNYELAEQRVGGFRFSEYVRQLRQDGHNIVTYRVSGSTFKYAILEKE